MKDSYGLLVQADGDPGDSTHRTGLYITLKKLEAVFNRRGSGEAAYALTKLRAYCHLKDGIHIRHPQHPSNFWCHHPSNFSRDQASRVILAYAVMGEKEYIREWLWSMAKRFFTHQNYKDPVKNVMRPPDIMAPGEWRNIIRGLSLWFLYPLLLILDAVFILDLYMRAEWDGGSLILPDMFYADIKYPTPFSKLALYLALNHTKIKEEILHNHDPVKSNGCEEVRDAFKDLFEIYTKY